MSGRIFCKGSPRAHNDAAIFNYILNPKNMKIPQNTCNMIFAHRDLKLLRHNCLNPKNENPQNIYIMIFAYRDVT